MRFRWRDSDRRTVEFEACSPRELAANGLDAAIQMRRYGLPYRTLALQLYTAARERPWRSLRPSGVLSPHADRDAVAARCRADRWWQAAIALVRHQHDLAGLRGTILEANRRYAPAGREWLW